MSYFYGSRDRDNLTCYIKNVQRFVDSVSVCVCVYREVTPRTINTSHDLNVTFYMHGLCTGQYVSLTTSC